MIEKILDLCGKWRFSFADHDTLAGLGYVRPDDPELSAPGLFRLDEPVFPEYEAEVPGNCELDIFKAGLGPDPYFGENALDYQKYETYHFFYTKEFESDGEDGLFLRFEGLDTAADVYLNGERVLRTENAFIPHEAGGIRLLRGKNRLAVHIKPAKLYVNKYPSTEDSVALSYLKPFLQLRKPASATGWDIAPRFLCGGIWRGVSLIRKRAPYIEDAFIYTKRLDGGDAVLFAEVSAVCPDGDHRVIIDGACGDSRFTAEAEISDGEAATEFTVRGACLWYPKNYGDPELYDVTVRLCKDGVTVDQKALRIGIRTVSLDRSEENGGKFNFYVNGQRIFVMGTNWVPVDAFHSRDRELIGRIFPALEESGCNCVRCWGGGVYECDELFDYCDSHGVLIWQDFMMACGVYPNDEGFLRRFAREAESVVKKYRNHPSLLLWAGDNECDQTALFTHMDPSPNKITRKTLPEILSKTDPCRPYLPSSPYVDETAYKRGEMLSEDHLWGPRDYYKGDYYRNAKAKFASETGYHGCPSPLSLSRFLSEESSKTFYDENGGIRVDWLVHSASPERNQVAPFSYRIPLMAAQVKELLGCVPSDMSDFAAASQISQAEAMKYFIERMRLRKAECGGVIWWNLIDCWPQISDAVIDWYGDKKLAYHVIKTVQRPVTVMAEEPVDGRITLVADSELCYGVTVNVTVARYGKPGVRSYTADVSAHSQTVVCETDYKNEFLLIGWEYEDGEGKTVRGRSHYIADARGISLDDLIDMYGEAGYGVKKWI